MWNVSYNIGKKFEKIIVTIVIGFLEVNEVFSYGLWVWEKRWIVCYNTGKKFEKINVTFVIMFLEGSCANYENVK